MEQDQEKFPTRKSSSVNMIENHVIKPLINDILDKVLVLIKDSLEENDVFIEKPDSNNEDFCFSLINLRKDNKVSFSVLKTY